MKKELNQSSDEFRFFQEFWGLHRDYYTPENDDRYWDNLIAHGSQIIEKYKDTDFGRFARDLVMCVIDNCDRKYRNKNLKYNIDEINRENEEKTNLKIKEFLEKNRGKTVDELLQ